MALEGNTLWENRSYPKKEDLVKICNSFTIFILFSFFIIYIYKYFFNKYEIILNHKKALCYFNWLIFKNYLYMN